MINGFRGLPRARQRPGRVNALLAFLLTAAALYFVVVLPMNSSPSGARRGQEPPPAAPSEEVRLLTEIRDLLTATRIPEQRRSS
jgi:large conductance mechanosensitive channel